MRRWSFSGCISELSNFCWSSHPLSMYSTVNDYKIIPDLYAFDLYNRICSVQGSQDRVIRHHPSLTCLTPRTRRWRRLWSRATSRDGTVVLALQQRRPWTSSSLFWPLQSPVHLSFWKRSSGRQWTNVCQQWSVSNFWTDQGVWRQWEGNNQ